MKDEICVSFIIPAYQAGSTIERCINSVLRIHAFTYEVIVVNDGSTDDTREIVEELVSAHDEVKLINQKNGGRSSARNRGIDVSCGKWMMFIDADDFLLDGAGSTIAKHVETRADMVMFAYEAPECSHLASSLDSMDFVNLVLDPTAFECAGLTLEESRKYWFRTPDIPKGCVLVRMPFTISSLLLRAVLVSSSSQSLSIMSTTARRVP